MTAICAPGGNAGTSVHLRSEGVTNECPSAAYAGGIRKTPSPTRSVAVTATLFIASSLVPKFARRRRHIALRLTDGLCRVSSPSRPVAFTQPGFVLHYGKHA